MAKIIATLFLNNKFDKIMAQFNPIYGNILVAI